MALKKRGKFFYGESQADIREALRRHGAHNGYEPVHFADAVCTCGARKFRLLLDDEEGVAIRVCSACGNKHPLGDSEEYLDEASPEECECPCGNSIFELTVGVALYASSEDVRWLYIGCRCEECGLTACYGDWKNEFNDYAKLLRRV
jgi:translation initiation factor 2 beta subunit (eIF-2beta)/eIF-5